MQPTYFQQQQPPRIQSTHHSHGHTYSRLRAQRAAAAAETKPYTPQSDLLFLLILGSSLVFIGTPVIYAWYAATQSAAYSKRRTPLPLLTDMFGDFPLLSSAIVGVGITMLFTGLIATAIARIPFSVQFHPRTKLVRYSVLVQISVWLVVPSSSLYPAGSDAMDWVHNISTFVFMVSTVYMLFVALGLCTFFVQAIRDIVPEDDENDLPALEDVESLQGTATAARVCLWIAAAGVLGATISVCVIAFGGWGETAEGQSKAPQYLWQILVACELAILLFCGLGYGLVIYTYAGIEALAPFAAAVTAARMDGPAAMSGQK